MELGISGKFAVVTGASAGIGRSVAVALAAEGVVVMAAARRVEMLEQLADEISAAGGKCHVWAGDLTDIPSANAFCDKVIGEFGGADILVNNLGNSHPRTDPSPYYDGLQGDGAPDEYWEKSLLLNFHANRRITQRLVGTMQERRWGRIINVTGTLEPPVANVTTPAKAATHAWAKGLSFALGKYGITVNSLPPGRIKSEQMDRMYPDAAQREAFASENIPLGCFGEAADFASVVTFLASERAKYVTGQTLYIDGGLSRNPF